MSRILGNVLAILTITITLAGAGISHANDAVKAKDEIEFLIGKISSKDRDIRQEAVTMLGQTQSPKAELPLINSLKNDQEWLVREKAAYALASFNSPTSIKALSHALHNDTVNYVRSASAKSLGEIKSEETINILTDLLKARTELDWRVRLIVVKLLGEIRSDSAMKALENLVTVEQSPDVKAEAVKLLQAGS